MPGAFPNSISPPPRVTPSKQTTTVPVKFDDGTPKNTTPIKPTEEEMHPKQHQQSTAKPLDEARWLGFSNMGAHTEPPKRASKIATLQDTPTKAPRGTTNVDSPKYAFSFRREQSLELSPEAKKLMSEKREEAARIREQMIANGDAPEDITDAVQRKMATPKGKKGRFSGVHMEQFKKMDSIAGHASAFRTDPTRPNSSGKSTQSQTKTPQVPHSATKSLKRSPSKAQLDDSEQSRSGAIPCSTSRSALAQPASQLPRSKSTKNFTTQTRDESSSPVKRVKRSEGDDMSIARPASSESEKSMPATPQPAKTNAYPDLSTLASPTEASLARAASIKSAKSSKIPGPPLSRSPSKATLQDATGLSIKPATPLLARSPSKASLFSNANVEKPAAMMSPLLMRSPSKASSFKKSSGVDEDVFSDREEKAKEAPLLARSPLKMSVTKGADSGAAEDKPSSHIPFLARSPAKISIAQISADAESSQTPGKTSNSIMGRFNLLRSSPMKSILRSPQRLYSDDPAKVAAGTHLATPPKYTASKAKPLPAPPAESASVHKRVDFSSSTKARYERAQSEASSTPSKGPTPPPKDVESQPSPQSALPDYPSLPSDDVGPVITPQKRRQTVTPGDFTFRAGGHGIVFGQSPNAPASVSNKKRPSTIRHVSAEPQLPPAPEPAAGSKKRKFDFENDKAVDVEMVGATSDKENAEEDIERPAKRAKPSGPEPSPVKPATRLPTLGVKPKSGSKDGKDKRPSMISRARLNALAQPKRRG